MTGNFSTPTPVSAVLTNPSTGMPIVDEPVTFTLNGSETCTANTDATGTATCDHHGRRAIEQLHADGIVPR